MTKKMKLGINMQTQSLDTTCPQYKGISESVLVIQNVCLLGKRVDSNFTKIRLHNVYRISIRVPNL
jgi:hypothetical protein